MSKELQISSPDNETQFIEALRKFWYATEGCQIELRENGEVWKNGKFTQLYWERKRGRLRGYFIID